LFFERKEARIRGVKSILTFLACIVVLGSRAGAGISFPGETIDEWHGFKRHRFEADGCAAWVVEPKAARSGQPWSWCMEFPDAFTERCAALQLLEAGFHHVHIVVGNTFGSPEAVKHFKAFHALMVEHGLAKRAALIGLSRGGMYAYRFASENPDAVAVIYGDAPLCDIRTVKGAEGFGKGSATEWANLTKAYGFKDDAEALAYRGNPVDTLAPLAKAKVAIIHVIGDADDVVWPAKNSDVIEQRYRQLGGEIQIIRKPGVGHQPHGLDDPRPVVDFILKHAGQP
jgi:pimeloyl-ACP methyl ester carboxylesterase